MLKKMYGRKKLYNEKNVTWIPGTVNYYFFQ